MYADVRFSMASMGFLSMALSRTAAEARFIDDEGAEVYLATTRAPWPCPAGPSRPRLRMTAPRGSATIAPMTTSRQHAGTRPAAGVGGGMSLIYTLPSIVERIDPATLFSTDQPLEVELGSGDSSFLVEYARLHPEHNFVGVERLLGRLRKLDRKGRRSGLTNLRGVRIECSYFLEYLLPAGSVAALHIYFPDPWPKRKHRWHRLINDRFPGLARQALAPGGVVYLRTDDEDYFQQMAAVFAANPGFGLAETPGELAGLLTDFEKDFQARGIRTLRAAYRARSP